MKKKRNLKSDKKNSLMLLYFIGLLLAISSALPAYIQSNFLNKFVSLEVLSLFFVIANTITIFCILAFPRLIRTLSNHFLSKLVLILYFLALLSLALTNSPLMALLSVILFTVANTLIWINMDIFVETFSDNSSTGATRTTYMTFMNLGWIIAPAISSQLIKISGYPVVFMIAAFLAIPVLLIIISQRDKLQDRVKYCEKKTIVAIKKTWENKNLRGIFFLALLLQIFYNSAVVYLPIYLHQILGIAWTELGLMFSIMLIPFLIFEIPAGIIADKYIGEKELLSLGFAIVVISLLLFFYVQTTSFWVWATILFCSRVGASLVEAMRETHFFKLVDAKDISYINIFRTTTPLGYIIGPILAISILAFLPINYIFLSVAILSLSSFYFIASIKDSK